MSHTVTAMRHDQPDSQDTPEQFEFQGQLYLVSEVLEHVQSTGELGHIEQWRARAVPVQLAAARVFTLQFNWWDGSWTVEPYNPQEQR